MRLRINRKEVTFVSNDVINGAGLSMGALGLFAYLLSMSGGSAADDEQLCSMGSCSIEELSGYKEELRAARLLIARDDGNEEIMDYPEGEE